jgi:hypothetical protein
MLDFVYFLVTVESTLLLGDMINRISNVNVRSEMGFFFIGGIYHNWISGEEGWNEDKLFQFLILDYV